MPDIDAAPHATPDQVRAAEKRAEAAAAARGESTETEQEERKAPPKGRRSTPSTTA